MSGDGLKVASGVHRLDVTVAFGVPWKIELVEVNNAVVGVNSTVLNVVSIKDDVVEIPVTING